MPLTIKPSSGSGSSTLISVAGTTTNDTLTLPAKTGNIITSADTGTVTGTMLASATVAGSNLTTGGPTWKSNGAVALLNGVTNATGTGITFPATQSASSDVNTLDDYEEGDWTPRIDGNTTAGTGTYTNQKGTYVKIGSLVMAKGYVTWSAHTGTGFMRVAGLPFSSSSTTNTYSSGTIYMDAATTITAGAVLQIYLGTSSASAITAFYTSGGASVTTTTMSNSGGFMVNIVYTV